MRFTSRGKKETIVTTTMLVLMPRPRNNMMIGATAATGAERNAITTGRDAWAKLRLIENESAIVDAKMVLIVNPSAAADNVKPV
jgi:hypothetical protein